MKRAANKTIIVTGGASGIGAATVKLLAAEGAKVLFCDIKAEQGKALEKELLAQSYEVSFVEADVRGSKTNEQLVKTAVEKFGGLNGIVCCAGTLTVKAFAEYEPEEWLDGIAVNCSASYYLAKHAIPAMIKSGGGSIVFMGDGCMDMPVPKMGCNLVAKMALSFLCRQIGVEHCRNNIRANIVSPTLVESSYWDASPELFEVLKCCSNAGNTFKPEDVASIILFMISDESKMLAVSNLKANDGFDCGFAYDQWAGLQ